MSTIKGKRSFSEMDNDNNEQNNNKNDKNNTNDGDIKQEAKLESGLPQIGIIEFRYDNQQFPSSLLSEIALLAFNDSSNENDKKEESKLKYDITEYLCKIGICVPCIYRICNNFQCISKQKNCNDRIISLIKMEQSIKSIKNKGCFICNDIYLKLHESLKNNKLLSKSLINEYEYKSYFLTLNIPPILTIRDFYIVHHLHYNIKQSINIISVPSNLQNNYGSHKDFIHFMIQNQSTQLIENNERKYTSTDQVDIFGINITFNFCHNFILNHIKASDLNKTADKKMMTKSAKKRDRFRKWDRRKQKNNSKKNDDYTNCQLQEYKFMKTFAAKQWMHKHHYLNSLKHFLIDFQSLTITVDCCKSINKDSFLTFKLLPWTIDTHNNDVIDVKIDIHRPPIFIAGEYNKYSRQISQTPFAFALSSVLTLIVQQMRRTAWDNNESNEHKIMDIDDDGVSESDVVQSSKSKIVNPHSNEHGWIDIKQDIATNNMFCCDNVTFHSAGREDMDVRMLGEGRPLLLQLLNPRKTISLSNATGNKLQLFESFCNENVNGMIKVNNLRVVSESYLEWMKSTENTKNKSYGCLCWISAPIQNQIELDHVLSENQIKYPLLLKQWTPIRVLHRRSLSERTKKINDIKLKWISSHWISVEIVAEAGTYIKEFCHGDRGRTFPNLASLLKVKNANIIQLDVLAVLT